MLFEFLRRGIDNSSVTKIQIHWGVLLLVFPYAR